MDKPAPYPLVDETQPELALAQQALSIIELMHETHSGELHALHANLKKLLSIFTEQPLIELTGSETTDIPLQPGDTFTTQRPDGVTQWQVEPNGGVKVTHNYNPNETQEDDDDDDEQQTKLRNSKLFPYLLA